MDFLFSEDFKKEVAEYDLKYRCMDCTHFDGPHSRCSFDYPTDEHHNFYVMDYGPKHTPRFSFCKHFEINC